MKVSINKINLKADTQSRVEINKDTVNDFADDIKRGDKFPPIILFKNNKNELFVGDGWHRINAYIQAGIKEIDADVRKGSQRDAVLYSVGANATHGLRRTNADKRKAVITLLDDPEWCQWSNIQIAKQCGVSDHFVGVIRKESTPIKSKSNIRKGADGRSINTKNIGTRKINPPKEEIIANEISPEIIVNSEEKQNKSFQFKFFGWQIFLQRMKK